MPKVIVITGATDGIGLELAKSMVSDGHQLLIHGRNEEKLEAVKQQLVQINANSNIDTFCADLSHLDDVNKLIISIRERYNSLDLLINNAGIFKTHQPITAQGFDVRFMVNTISPYVLTKQLSSLMTQSGRIINVSSAAQASVSLDALRGTQRLSDSEAYAQSKLAIIMWTFDLAKSLGKNAPALIALNPASFLGSKMVKEAYGSEGKDLSIGVDIIYRVALSVDFAGVTGRYFDNDIGEFAQPHPDALDDSKNEQLVKVLEKIIN